jgi:hypothetical protein
MSVLTIWFVGNNDSRVKCCPLYSIINFYYMFYTYSLFLLIFVLLCLDPLILRTINVFLNAYSLMIRCTWVAESSLVSPSSRFF